MPWCCHTRGYTTYQRRLTPGPEPCFLYQGIENTMGQCCLVSGKHLGLSLRQKHSGTCWTRAERHCQPRADVPWVRCHSRWLSLHGHQNCYWTKLGSACLPHSKANLLTLGCVEGKYTVLLQGTSKLMLRRLKLPNGFFQGWVFKGNICGEGCRVHDFWLVGGEVTGWYFGNLNHQPPGLVQSEVWCLWSACSHHPQPGWGSWLLQNNSKIHVRLFYILLEEELGLCFIPELLFQL